jgi:galactosylxylosylprotein 3-beta-galactosyltransferase
LCDQYIPYALGGGYVLSVDLVRFISANANILRTYRAEDASVGTWLAPLKVHRVHDTRFDTEWRSRGCSNTDLVSHKQSVQEMRSKQYSLVSKGVLCEREMTLHKTYEYNWKVPPSKCCPGREK